MLRAGLIAGLAVVLSACAATPQPKAAVAWRVCEPALAKAGAACATITVPENYSRADGRRIGLNVIVLPALTDDGLRDAQFDLEGGPGLAGTGAAGFYLGPGAAYRRQRDLVFVDMRGTGESNPLRCPGVEAHDGDPWAPM